MTQALDIRAFLELLYPKKNITENDPENLVLILGDFNVNSRAEKISKKFIGKINENVDKFLNIIEDRDIGHPDMFREYDGLVNLISGNHRDEILNLGDMGNGGVPPVTMGEVLVGEDGERYGRDLVLSHRKDQMAEKCIDFCLVVLKGEGKNGGGGGRGVGEKFVEMGKSCRVNKFLVEGQKFGQCSDHFGVDF
jgi:hypothetical protein